MPGHDDLVKETDSFGAVPKRLLRALHLREIDYHDFAILCYLTLAENHRTGEWIGTTAKMADEIGWEHSADYLAKKLKRLAERDWIESGAARGSRKPYPIRLTENARWVRDRTDIGLTTESKVGSQSELTSDGPNSKTTANPPHDADAASPDIGSGRTPKKETAAAEEDEDLDLGLGPDVNAPSRARDAAPVEEQDPKIGEGTAAAAAAAAGSPPSESEIRAAVESLRGADKGSPNVIEPLARRVTRETFVGLVERARKADNPVGWLKRRLEGVIREERLDEQAAAAVQAPATIERASLEEALEANVQQLARSHPWEDIAQLVSDSFGPEHVDAARAIYDRTKEAA